MSDADFEVSDFLRLNLGDYLDGIERALLVGLRDDLLRRSQDYLESAEHGDGDSFEAWLEDHDLDTAMEIVRALDAVNACYLNLGLDSRPSERDRQLHQIRDEQAAKARREVADIERRREAG